MDNLINGEKPEFGNPKHIAVLQKAEEDARLIEEMKGKKPIEIDVEEVEMYIVRCPECDLESEIVEQPWEGLREITEEYKHPETGETLHLCSNCKQPLYER